MAAQRDRVLHREVIRLQHETVTATELPTLGLIHEGLYLPLMDTAHVRPAAQCIHAADASAGYTGSVLHAAVRITLEGRRLKAMGPVHAKAALRLVPAIVRIHTAGLDLGTILQGLRIDTQRGVLVPRRS